MSIAELPIATSPGPRVHRFTREEYYDMADAGLISVRRVELLDGEIFDMAPQNNPHALAIVFVDYALRRVFGSEFTIRVQLPFVVNDRTEIEPDIAVIAGNPRSHSRHPDRALLVVEVAESSLDFDRVRKGAAYAACGVADYWIVNLTGRCVEVYRNPTLEAATGMLSYAPPTIFAPPAAISPLAALGATIPVADLLP